MGTVKSPSRIEIICDQWGLKLLLAIDGDSDESIYGKIEMPFSEVLQLDAYRTVSGRTSHEPCATVPHLRASQPKLVGLSPKPS